MAEMVQCRVNGQFDIILPKHRADRPEWYTDKGWEKERLKAMHSTINKGDVVLYIGNEEGDMSGLIASWGGKLILMEPNPKVWPNTKAIWDANGFENPFACFVGFASEKNTAKIAVIKDGFPACADGVVIHDHGFMELRDGNAEEIKIDTLIEILHVAPKHISIDVEGSEWQVLKGAEKTMREHKPVLWVSIHPEYMIKNYNQWSYELRHWIKGFGYKETLLAYDHECHFMYTPL